MNNDNLKKTFLDGKLLLFHKPWGWTSADLVKKVKNILKQKLQLKKIKVGHAGTLDPLADGLLILCTGKETKNISTYQSQKKSYLAKMKSLEGKKVALMATGLFPAALGRRQTLAYMKKICIEKEAEICGEGSVGWWSFGRERKIERLVEDLASCF